MSGREQSGVPGDRRSPIMAGDDGAIGLERRDDPDHVADEMKEGIFVDLFRTLGQSRSRACRARRRDSPPPPAP